MLRIADTRHAFKYLLGALLVSAVGARQGTSQQPKAQLGLSAAGGIGVFLGGGAASHHVSGGEGGVLLDLGWVGSRRVRLVGDASMFAGSLHEYVAQDDRDFSGAVFDLSSTVSLVVLTGSMISRHSAYASAGLSIHALSSSFGSVPLDQRYNANRFGVAGAIGGRTWIGRSGRRTLYAELRGQGVKDVDRWSVRAGYMHNFGPLTRPSAR